MKIFAYGFRCVQKGKNVTGVEIRVGTDSLELEKKMVHEVENDGTGVEKRSVNVISREYITLEYLVSKLKPEFEKLVKTAKMKSELLDAISKLPID